MILFAMTWLISRSTVPILSELPTSLYDDASNGYHASTWLIMWLNEHNVTKKPGTIYGGSCTFLSDKHCCNRYSLPLFASTTGHLGLYRSKKINGDTTKIDLQILMWNHYTPPLPPRKNSHNRVHWIYINGSQRTRHRSLSFNPGLHITPKIQ